MEPAAVRESRSEGQMEHLQFSYNPFERRPIVKSRAPAVKWVREWVPQDVVATGGKCYLLKWITEDALKKLKEKVKEPEVLEPEPEPTTEVLFLCSYEGCGKTFVDASSLRKHSHIHGERQYVCHYEGCGKKFLDSSKLKRHFLIHTGERDFICPHEGCGKAFSLDFNLRSHMKTHSQENYHICPYPGCGKRYAHEYKLRNHISTYHEKSTALDTPKYTAPAEKPSRTPKSHAVAYGSASSDRPYVCPYDGCEKAYIHQYKLNLHLRREHPGHLSEENPENATPSNNNNNVICNNNVMENDLDEGSDQDAYGKRVNGKTHSQTLKRMAKTNLRMPPAKVTKKGSKSSPATVTVAKRPWPVKEMEEEEEEEEEEDSEETEEDRENVDDGWRYGENNDDDDDDEETEDED